MKKFALLTLASLLLVGFGCTTDTSVTETSDSSEVEVVEQIDETPTLDSDGDGITDYDEIEIYQTDPHSTDTDNDGYPNDEEIAAGYDPNEPATSSTTERVHVQDSGTEHGLEYDIDIEVDVTTTVDCGPDPSCFDEKFTNCEPATMTGDLSGWVAMSYEITGQAEGGCAVTAMYTQNPNPDYENLPLYCVVDNSQDFETAITETWQQEFTTQGYCTGPFDEMFWSVERSDNVIIVE